MPRFLIEVPHEAEPVACARAVKILFQSGSHYLTHADFGCRDGVHKGWIVIDAEDKTEARLILHPFYSRFATITELNKFTVEELDELIDQHQANSTNAAELHG